jgi:hypothetical protein
MLLHAMGFLASWFGAKMQSSVARRSRCYLVASARQIKGPAKPLSGFGFFGFVNHCLWYIGPPATLALVLPFPPPFCLGLALGVALGLLLDRDLFLGGCLSGVLLGAPLANGSKWKLTALWLRVVSSCFSLGDTPLLSLLRVLIFSDMSRKAVLSARRICCRLTGVYSGGAGCAR